MAFTNAIFHPMLDAAATTAVSASLHAGDPGTTGANEVSGGEYTRVPVAWQSPSGGAIVATDELVFAVPALGSDEATHVGLWDSSGTWLGPVELAVAQPFPTPGTLTVEPVTLSMSS